MQRLWLLRHGEAEPGSAGLDDAQRRLTPHGRRECFEVAQLFDASGLKPDLILASTAHRAVETAGIVATQLHLTSVLRYVRALYLAEPATLLSVVQAEAGQTRGVLIVGHNPGLSEFAQQVSGFARAVELRTAGLYRIDFELPDWSQLGTRTATAVKLMR